VESKPRPYKKKDIYKPKVKIEKTVEGGTCKRHRWIPRAIGEIIPYQYKDKEGYYIERIEMCRRCHAIKRIREYIFYES
jgi:hypothetical protein